MTSSIAKPECRKNEPLKKGALASKRVFFGPFSRFCVYAVHTRFSDVCWFVRDSERIDELGMPEVIRQEPTFELAIAGIA